MLSTRMGWRGPAEKLLRAGPLTIDRSERRAMLAGRTLQLSPLLLKLLAALAKRPGRVVSRIELKKALWPYAERIDTERRLNTAVRALRAELADDAETPQFIETVRSCGYRWMVPAVPVRGRPKALLLAASLPLFFAVASFAPQPHPFDRSATLRAQVAVDEWRAEPSADGLRRATAAVDAAAGAGDTPATETLKGHLALESRWDWRGAERHFQKALRMDGENADAKLGLAWLLANRGEAAEAIALTNEILETAVLSEDRRANLGWLLIRLGRSNLAVQACTGGKGSHLNLLSCAHMALALEGHIPQAREVGAVLMERIDADPRLVAAIRTARPVEGYQRFLRWRAQNFLPQDATWFNRAQVLADAGYQEEAFANLAKSVATREPLAIKIASTPSFAAMRSHPRFRALAAQVGVKT